MRQFKLCLDRRQDLTWLLGASQDYPASFMQHYRQASYRYCASVYSDDSELSLPHRGQELPRFQRQSLYRSEKSAYFHRQFSDHVLLVISLQTLLKLTALCLRLIQWSFRCDQAD